MTWAELYLLLKNMEETNHTCFNKPVVGIINGEPIDLDIVESLTSGDAFFIQALIDTDEVSDAD